MSSPGQRKTAAGWPEKLKGYIAPTACIGFENFCPPAPEGIGPAASKATCSAKADRASLAIYAQRWARADAGGLARSGGRVASCAVGTGARAAYRWKCGCDEDIHLLEDRGQAFV